MSESKDLAVAILAAGQGKRMGNPDRAKVLTTLNNRPLIEYVLNTAAELSPALIVVVVGHQRDAVKEFVASVSPNAICVVQNEQLGTGHAVQQIEHLFGAMPYDVLILSGDVPLLSASTLKNFINRHFETDAALTVLTTVVDNPAGYGRIVRNGQGALSRVVEHKDASPEELNINEINSGVYIVDSRDLFAALSEVRNSNAQKEYYLTDIVSILVGKGKHVEAYTSLDADELHGINTLADLERAQSIMNAEL